MCRVSKSHPSHVKALVCVAVTWALKDTSVFWCNLGSSFQALTSQLELAWKTSVSQWSDPLSALHGDHLGSALFTLVGPCVSLLMSLALQVLLRS